MSSAGQHKFLIPSIRYPDPSRKVEADEVLHLDRGIYLMESFWRSRESEDLKVALADKNAYNLTGLPELHHATVQLHRLVNPTFADRLVSRELLFGMGATQCFHAAIYAIHKTLDEPVIVTSQMPSYLEYKNLISIHHAGYATWMDVNELPSDLHNVIEIVCSPNNPDGKVLRPVTLAAYTIHDRVNHWPFFMENFHLEDYSSENISIYSYPKILGFSASRVGYMFVSDAALAEHMRNYIVFACHGLCTEGQLKCLLGVQYILEHADTFIDTLTSLVKERWERFSAACATSKIPLKLLNNSGPTAWLQFPSDAKELLDSYGIVATYGPEYAADATFARFNLLMMPNVFEALLHRMC